MLESRRFLQVSPQEIMVGKSRTELIRFRKQYLKQHAFVIRRIFSDDLISDIEQGISHLKFKAKSYRRLGHEENAAHASLNRILDFFFNHGDFLDIIRSITGLDEIRTFSGRFYRMSQHGDHHFNWHNDKQDTTRLLGMSINLSRTPYRGGVFQLRRSDTREIVFENSNVGFCDAHFFEISHALDHRVTRVQGPNHKLSFAGWFTK